MARTNHTSLEELEDIQAVLNIAFDINDAVERGRRRVSGVVGTALLEQLREDVEDAIASFAVCAKEGLDMLGVEAGDAGEEPEAQGH